MGREPSNDPPKGGGVGQSHIPEGNVTRRGGPRLSKRRAERQPARRRRTPHPGWGEC
jgi:hypothetical protein